MVVVEVADHDEVDRVRVLTAGPERRRRVAALDALDVAILLRHPDARAGFDEDPLTLRLDQQTVQPAVEPPALIGLGEARPQGSRHDPEEAAGIGPEPAGAQQPDANFARVHAGIGFRRQLVARVAHRSCRQRGISRPRSKAR